MKYVFAILTTLVFALSCRYSKDKNSGPQANETTTSTGQPLSGRKVDEDSLTVIEKLDSTTLIYNEEKMTISLSYLDTNRIRNLIPIGKYHNTFGQPPHETKLISSLKDKDEIFALLFTNIVQSGFSSDNLHVLKINKRARTVTQICKFEELARYSDKSGIDTLSGIKQYDYEIKRNDKNSEVQVILYEYMPYKFEDELKNKRLVYKTRKWECVLESR